MTTVRDAFEKGLEGDGSTEYLPDVTVSDVVEWVTPLLGLNPEDEFDPDTHRLVAVAKCGECEGRGRWLHGGVAGPGEDMEPIYRTCPACNGAGLDRAALLTLAGLPEIIPARVLRDLGDTVLLCEDVRVSANGALRRIKDICIRLMEAQS